MDIYTMILFPLRRVTDMKPDIDKKKKSACFVILLLIDILDLVCDWLFFLDVFLIEKGLVFGPHEPALVWAVLAFTIVGTIDFPLQMYVTVMESLVNEPRPKDEKRVNKYNLVILVLEDIPQVILLLLVSLCREDPSSIWSLTKASFVLLTSVIKLVPNIKACCKKFSCLKTVIFVGALLEFTMGVTVFFATQIELTDTGALHFNKPTTVVDERFNDNAYLSDVSLFIHDPNILTGDASMTMPSDSDLPWIRLDYLRHIQKSEYCSMRFEYEKGGRHKDVNKLKILVKDGDAASQTLWKAVSCYTISTSTGTVEVIDPSSLSCFQSTSKSNKMTINFKYIEPEALFKKHVMGDIVFNSMYQKSGKTQITNLTSSVFSSKTDFDDGKNKYEELNLKGIRIKTPILLHYFKHQPVAVQSKGHENNVLTNKKKGKTVVSLYRNRKEEMIDVKDVWKTGWRRCPTTGNLGPRFDSDVKVTT